MEKLPRYAAILIGVFTVLVLGIIDFVTGFEISFSLLYLLPVSLVSWRLGIIAGSVTSGLAAVTWHLANLLAGHSFSSPMIPYWNAATRLGFFLIVTLLLSRLKLAFERERVMSRTDHLTAVANSRAFYDIASREISRAHRYGHPLTMAYIDIDNFKTINDLFGHKVGDAVLRVVAQTASQHIRSTDYLARLGGDEFALLLTETGEEGALTVLHKIQSMLLSEMEKNTWPISFSIGAITFVEPPPTLEKMISMADGMMYAAKSKGKNRIEHVVAAKEVI